MRRTFFFSSIVFLLIHASAALASEWSGTVTKVIDGDTVQVVIDAKQVLITLSDIAAPELDQPFGPQAKQFVEDLALNQKIKIFISDEPTSNKDKITAEIFVPQKQDSLNRTLVREGLAWPVPDQKKRNPHEIASAFAQKRHLGFWSTANPLPPWEYKKQDALRKRTEKEIEADRKILQTQIEKQKIRTAQSENENSFSSILKKTGTRITELYADLIFYIKLYMFKVKYWFIELFEKARSR